jgi:hypothetical protein
MTNEECAKALEDIQRRAYRHQNTGSAILLARVPASPQALREIGYFAPDRKPARKPEAGAGGAPKAVR